LADNVSRFKRKAFSGVEADYQEVQSIETYYKDVRTILTKENPDLFG
jgi:hypothetical protein